MPVRHPTEVRNEPPAEDGFLTAQEVARLLHLQVKRVQTLARGGALPAIRVGRNWLFPRNRLFALLRPSGKTRRERWRSVPEINCAGA